MEIVFKLAFLSENARKWKQSIHNYAQTTFIPCPVRQHNQGIQYFPSNILKYNLLGNLWVVIFFSFLLAKKLFFCSLAKLDNFLINQEFRACYANVSSWLWQHIKECQNWSGVGWAHQISTLTFDIYSIWTCLSFKNGNYCNFSPCFPLSHHMYYEAINCCKDNNDPNNPKIRQIIIWEFSPQNAHYFVGRTHQILVIERDRVHDDGYCRWNLRLLLPKRTTGRPWGPAYGISNGGPWT